VVQLFREVACSLAVHQVDLRVRFCAHGMDESNDCSPESVGLDGDESSRPHTGVGKLGAAVQQS
jgi:hypothetical protein